MSSNLKIDVKDWHDKVSSAKNYEELTKIYTDTAEQYDDIVTELELDEKKQRFSEFCGALLKPEHHILDVGAGTGNLAMRLQKFNCTNIDGMEPVKEFANIALKRKLYNKIFPEVISHTSPCSIASNTYDAAVCSGVVVPAHLEAKDLDELLRVVKVGGYVMFYYTSTWEGYEEFCNGVTEKLNQLENSGKIVLLSEKFEESPKVNLTSRLVAYSKLK